MMRLPPRWVRRLVLAPLAVVLAVVMLLLSPVWLLVTLLLDPLGRGHLRLARLLWMVTYYLLWDALALVALLGLWVGSGFGLALRTPRFQRAHYVLVGWFLRRLFLQARWTLRLRIRRSGQDPDAVPTGVPVIVASRHAGPGDSLILVHALTNVLAREPRIVLKDTLQWDPAIDVMLNRLPSTFVAARPDADRPVGPGGVAAQIADLARGLDDNDALVIFPEGGNVSAERRARRIHSLRRAGLGHLADRAERLLHVMAPRPGGLFAAIDAAPDAGVVFVAHTGLERLVTIGDIWRELPMDKQITMVSWWVPPGQVPDDPDARLDWLYGWWERIDAWIEDRRPREDRLGETAGS